MKNLLRSIKKTMWAIGLISNCPVCGDKTEKIGHPKEAGWQYYRCVNPNCTFGR